MTGKGLNLLQHDKYNHTNFWGEKWCNEAFQVDYLYVSRIREKTLR